VHRHDAEAGEYPHFEEKKSEEVILFDSHLKTGLSLQ
jgi:hypothetical protein